MNKKIYLDYASTTPVDPIVIKTMLPYFNKKFANTMSFHQMGAQAFETVEKARELVADAINAKKDEIIFTSSATESNNMALKGIANSYKRKGNHIIISAIEHPSIFNTAKTLEKEGFEISILTVDKNGIIDPKVLESNIKKNTILVSIIHANNEIGTIQNIKILGGICKTNNVFFHVDASQSFTKIPIDVKKENIDLLTASSHKIYGPKGAGLLYLKEGILLKPLLEGGGHERNLRSSTLNVPAIVGFAKATEIGVKLMKKENKRLLKLRNKLLDGILKKIPATKLNGDLNNRLANNVNVSFSFIEGESLLLELNLAGIFVSTGSACSSPKLEPSNILMAIGNSAEDAHGSIRFSLGRYTKSEDVNYVLRVLPKIVKRLRKFSPFNK